MKTILDDLTDFAIPLGILVVILIFVMVVLILGGQYEQEMLQLCLGHGYSAYHDGACYSNTIELGR